MYTNENGQDITAEQVNQSMEISGYSDLSSYLKMAGLTPGKKKGSVTNADPDPDPNAESWWNTGLGSEDGFSESANTKGGSLKQKDPISQFYVTAADLRSMGDEEDAVPVLNKRFAPLGISSKEGTSWGSTNAINLQNTPDSDFKTGVSIIDIGKDLIGNPFNVIDAIGIGKNKTDEELSEAANKINDYIKNKGDINYLDKAKKRSSSIYKKYTESLEAPELADKDLRAQAKAQKLSDFSKILRGEKEAITRRIGGEMQTIGIKETPATIDNFNNDREFQAYNQWKKNGYIQDFSAKEISDFDQERRQKYALDKSVSFASDSSGEQKTDILALAAEDERKLNNFASIKDEYYNSSVALENSIKEFNINPTFDNYAVASTIEIDYLRRQGEIQLLQNKLDKQGTFSRAKTVPLALLDFNKDYNRLRQLRTGFKNVGSGVAYGAATLMTLAGAGNDTNYFGKNTSLSDAIEENYGLVSLGRDMQKESENFQRAIAVDEITSVKDAGRWVAGSTVNLVPSLAMAFTGPAAMPLFFLSGAGGKGIEMAVSQKDASDRMIKNKQFLADNPDVIMDRAMYEEMEADAKTLDIPGWQSVSISALYGIGEVVSERLGTMILAKNLKNGIKMLPPTTVKEGFQFAGKQLGEGIFIEGGSEFGNTVFQNFGDIVILGEDKNIFEGGLESFAQGALMGGAMNSVNLSKGLRQGYVSVLASRAESSELKSILARIQKITGDTSIQSWTDVKNLDLLPKETQDIVSDLIKDMKAKEQGVLFKLGATLSFEQAYAVEETNRKMRLINKRLIDASTNPNIKAAQLKDIEAELRVQFDALSAEREGLLSDKAGAKKTNESYVDANVSLDSSLGYSYYQASMLNESLMTVLSEYQSLSPEANQSGLDAAKEALIKAGKADPSVDEIKTKARNTYVDSVYKEKITKGKKFALDFATQNGLDLKEQTFEFETEAEANEAYLQAMINVLGAKVDEIKGYVKVTAENKDDYPDNKIGDNVPQTLRDQILNGDIDGGEYNGTIYVNMNVAVKNKRVGIYAHEVLHKYAKTKYKDNQNAIDKAGEDLLAYLEKNQPDLHTKVEFRINQSYTEKNEEGDSVKGEFYYEEAMNAMSDLLADGQIVNESTMSQIRFFANSFLTGLGADFQFNKEQGRGAYEFVKNYNKSAHFGGTSNIANPIVKDGGEPEEVTDDTNPQFKLSLTVKQDLKWRQTDEALVTKFKVGERDFKMTLEETAFMEFDEGQTYQDIEDIAKELGITEDKDGDGIESSERYFHYEFGDVELGKDITGTGNAMEVFSVAINGAADYINKKKKVEGVIFTAKEPSRIKLYKTLGQSLADKIGGSFAYKNDTFVVSKNPPKAIKFSKSTPLEAINALVPAEVTTQDQYFNRKVFNPIYKATENNGVISNYVKSKSPSKEVAAKTIKSIQERLVNYDPAAERKKAGNKQPITFGEFIFANTNFGKLDAKKALFKESEDAKKTTDLDNKEAQSKIAEDDVAKKDTPKFRKLIDSGVLPGVTIKNIGSKLTKVLKVLKSRLDAKVSINKSVSPLIAEIKQAMGKQADIDLKEAMGGKADAKLQKWLLKNKKAILENMTTTWLMGAIPQAIQKSVGGTYKVDDAGVRIKDSYGDFTFVPNFTSDWQGKTVDREKTSTNKLGKTAGGDIVRRLPNIATALSDVDFVSSVLEGVSIDEDGNMTSGAPIRGRKESMAKAIAEEISLEVFNRELQDENSEISKAFENNQAARGVVLANNFVEDIARQSERGQVKFSKSISKKNLDIFNSNSEQILTKVREANVNITGNTLYNISKSVLGDRIDDKELKNYTSEIANHVQRYVKSVDIESKVDFNNFVFEGLQLKESNSNLYKAFNFTRAQIGSLAGLFNSTNVATQRGLSYAFNVKMVEEQGEEGVIKILKWLSGHQTSNGRIGGGRNQSYAGNKDYIENNLKNIPNVTIKFIEGKAGTDKKGRPSKGKTTITEVYYKGIKIENLKSKLATPPQKAGDNTEKSRAKFTKDYELREAAAREAWGVLNEYLSFVKESGNKIDWIMTMMSLKSNMSSILKAAAPVKYYYNGVYIGALRYEHMIPTEYMVLKLTEYYWNGKKFDLDVLRDRYNVAIIPVKMDDNFNIQRQSQMRPGYDPMVDLETERYFDKGTLGYDNMYAIEAIGGGNKGTVYGESWIKLSKSIDIKALNVVKIEQKAINNARSIKWSQSPKKIRVFDFDDTLAQTKSNVLYTMPDGTKGKIDAATFAKEAGNMEAEGAQWDFSEFSKVMDGKAGPLLEVAKIIADKRGTKDVFVLTARPADAAGPIQEFLASLGLNIPIENITGLGNGSPKSKADWIINKVAEGYNDFYFADDHTGNVKAVKDVLDTFDVKGKVQLAKVKFSATLDTEFNDMIQRHKGVESFKEFSKSVAQRRGKKTGKWKFFISPSAEDFRGLTQYKFAGKGKQGEADQRFFEESLMDPYFQGIAAIEQARQTIKNDTAALLNLFKPVKKKLNKLIEGGDYTNDAAVRVYLWNKAGYEIPGISKRDNKKLNDLVANDPELSAFADGLLLVSKKDAWPEPGAYWTAQTTLSDLNDLTEKGNRKEYLAEFIENVDIIFSEKNLNKVEAIYGEASRKAIENAIFAMKTGSNSPNQGADGITSKWMNWVNSSVGTIMFFNRRSAVLQLLSTTNFINWSDNNPAKAALAFANQPQYWKDFVMIFNSDKLKQRRGGLKSDVQESEIANAAKNTQDKAQAVISYILKLGFTPTQIADSFAISSGGATMYRNRVNTYKKQGMTEADAETKAFEDFSKLSDEAQQSGDPALVSQQQRSVAGRLILSFQNTTMQYTRLMKKAGQDLINRRGDPKTHISKIIYYGAIQNFIFNAMSQTLFALIPGFDEDDEDEDDAKKAAEAEKKTAGILNGMVDSLIRGSGIYGAIFSTIKNTYRTFLAEEKKGFTGDQTKTIIEAANLSPAIGSKLRKIYSAIQTNQFDKDVIEKYPWSVTIDGKFNPSPSYNILGDLTSALVNVPLDRALTEARGVAEALDNRNSYLQRIALGLGWRTWNVGAKNEEFDLIKAEAKVVRKKEGREKAKVTRAKNKEKEKQRVSNLSPAEKLKEKNAKDRKKRDAALLRKQKKQEASQKTNDSMVVEIKKYQLEQSKLKK